MSDGETEEEWWKPSAHAQGYRGLSGDEIMSNRIELLDHGYATKIEHWGSDEDIICAARMSTDGGFNGWGPILIDEVCKGIGIGGTRCDGGILVSDIDVIHGTKCTTCNGKGFKSKPGDEKLLRYLWENKHVSPFEMAGMTIEVQAPVIVFRQWHRHRTQSFSEMSARYTPLPDLDYVPTVDRLMQDNKKNRQAGKAAGSETMTVEKAEAFQDNLRLIYATAQDLYEVALAHGVPKELARLHLPVARYSRMRASANLRNWLGFLTLRLDPHAQYEIRVYAEAVGEFIKEAFPRTWELFAEGLR